MGQVRLACSTLAFNDRPLPEALRAVADLEFQFADLAVFPGTFGHLQPEAVAADLQKSSDLVEAACRSTGVRIAAINAAIGDAAGAAAHRLVMGLLLFAHRVDATVVTLSAGSKTPEETAAVFAPWLELGDRYGVKLAPEIHLRSVTERPAGCRTIARHLPGIRFTLDPSHILIQKESLADWADVVQRTAHVHIRDAGPGGWDEVQVPWGKGNLDLKDLIDRLDRIDYYGTLSIEYIHPLSMNQPAWDHVDSIRRARAAILKLLAPPA